MEVAVRSGLDIGADAKAGPEKLQSRTAAVEVEAHQVAVEERGTDAPTNRLPSYVRPGARLSGSHLPPAPQRISNVKALGRARTRHEHIAGHTDPLRQRTTHARSMSQWRPMDTPHAYRSGKRRDESRN